MLIAALFSQVKSELCAGYGWPSNRYLFGRLRRRPGPLLCNKEDPAPILMSRPREAAVLVSRPRSDPERPGTESDGIATFGLQRCADIFPPSEEFDASIFSICDVQGSGGAYLDGMGQIAASLLQERPAHAPIHRLRCIQNPSVPVPVSDKNIRPAFHINRRALFTRSVVIFRADCRGGIQKSPIA